MSENRNQREKRQKQSRHQVPYLPAPKLGEVDVAKEETWNWIRQVVVKYNLCPWAKQTIDEEKLKVMAIYSNDLLEIDEVVIKEIIALRDLGGPGEVEDETDEESEEQEGGDEDEDEDGDEDEDEDGDEDGNEADAQNTRAQAGRIKDKEPSVFTDFNYHKQPHANISATTVIALPNVLHSFDDYLNYVAYLEGRMEKDLLCGGILQIASFHPQYEFAEHPKYRDDLEHAARKYTNRTPYPTLHIIREDDVEDAMQVYGNTSEIWKRNELLMDQIGEQAMQQTLQEIKVAAGD